MFTLEQIDNIHERLGKQTSLPEYLLALNSIGVIKYDSFLTDGHSEYYGMGDYKVVSQPTHEKYSITTKCNRQDFLEHLSLHEQGKTNYFEMTKGLANSGIEKWTFDTVEMTITYYDIKGNEVLAEKLEANDNE